MEKEKKPQSTKGRAMPRVWHRCWVLEMREVTDVVPRCASASAGPCVLSQLTPGTAIDSEGAAHLAPWLRWVMPPWRALRGPLQLRAESDATP